MKKDGIKKYVFVVPDAYEANVGNLTEDAIQRIFSAYQQLRESLKEAKRGEIPFVDLIPCPEGFWSYMQNATFLEGGVTKWASSVFDFTKQYNAKVLVASFSTVQKYTKVYLENLEDTQTKIVNQLNELSENIVSMSRFDALYVKKITDLLGGEK